MGYASYILPDGREAGYAVQATCDQPGCGTEIDRGLYFLCGETPAGEYGCGRYFCDEHMCIVLDQAASLPQLCVACLESVNDQYCPGGISDQPR